ncbi:MAG: hypothetical protein Q4F24_09165 [Eubacteriales bacterium]|nr:hypothetical protein [Eubacteriales bacterium]
MMSYNGKRESKVVWISLCFAICILTMLWIKTPVRAAALEVYDIYTVGTKNTSPAVAAYKKYLKTNYRGWHYAIVNAGYKKQPILMVTNAFNYIFFQKYYGYGIRVCTYKNGKVVELNEFIPQSTSAGPWYYYKNKLYSRARRGGYFRLDILSKGYKRPFFQKENKTIFKEKNRVKLKKNNS